MQTSGLSRGAIAIAGGLWLAGTSSAAVAQTASATPPAPASRQSSQPQSSVVAVPEVLRFQVVPKFLAGVPFGPFGNNVGTSPGAAVDFTVRVGETPISVGAAFDYLRYGTETRRLSVFPSVPEVLNDVSTTNNVIRTHALVRVQPRAGRVRPYAEGSSASVMRIPGHPLTWAMTVAVRGPRIWATSRRASAREPASRSGSRRGARVA